MVVPYRRQNVKTGVERFKRLGRAGLTEGLAQDHNFMSVQAKRKGDERPARMVGAEGRASVIKLQDFSDVPSKFRGAFVAVGNFDGVHRGHAQLLQRLKSRADSIGVPAIALTFDPPPATFLRPETAPSPLTWIDRRVSLLVESGINDVGVFQTGQWLLRLTAREFFDQVLVEQLGAKGIVEGPTFGFGRDRGGDARLLGGWCVESGLGFEVVAPSHDGGIIVSSSRIRQALAQGEVEAAAQMLGRPHRIRGLITHGAGRGAGIGVPTANLDEIDTVIPDDGVYAAHAFIEGAGPPLPVACNIGPNPTFGEQLRKVEAHLIDFSGDLYSQSVELDILARIRPTRRFEGLEDLLTQIRDDIAQARTFCSR